VSPAVADRECRSALQRSAATVVYFERGLPGFDGLRRWELVELDEAQPFRFLRSVERPQLALPVADPGRLVAGYRPAIPPGVWSRLGDGSEGRSLLFVVVSPGDEGASANLCAPLVIDPQTMRGEQVILDDGEWPVRFELARPEEGAAHSGTGRSPACSSSAAR
jgi:flagellar assembly factor FliW